MEPYKWFHEDKIFILSYNRPLCGENRIAGQNEMGQSAMGQTAADGLESLPENPFHRSVTNVDNSIKRGDIYYADHSPVVGSEQGGVRPVLNVQNNVGNRFSPTVIAAAITSQVNKAKMPTHIELGARSFGLTKDSVVLMEQIRTLDKKRLREKMGCLDEAHMRHVDEALAVSFGLEQQVTD